MVTKVQLEYRPKTEGEWILDRLYKELGQVEMELEHAEDRVADLRGEKRRLESEIKQTHRDYQI